MLIIILCGLIFFWEFRSNNNQ